MQVIFFPFNIDGIIIFSIPHIMCIGINEYTFLGNLTHRME